ncbi:MAG: ATP-dependent RecD-like DNA helicase [Gemmataceae bacterium]
MSEKLSGTIERVTFHNPENGFIVLRVKAKGRRELITVVGRSADAAPGELLDAEGIWQADPEHGPQFAAELIRTAAPHTPEGIEKFLGSGLIRGIGPTYAKKIVAVFGARTLQVLDESPTFLKEIRGIGPRRIQQIRESWNRQKAVRSIMVFLQSHGVGTARAVRIHKTYGDRALDIVRADPYRLAEDIWGFGFRSADELAMRLGIDRQSRQRAQAAVRFALDDAVSNGHCGYPEDQLIQAAQQLVGIDAIILREAVDALVHAGSLVRESVGETWLWLKRLHDAETTVAERLARFMQSPSVNNVEAAAVNIEAAVGLKLAPEQSDALREAARSRVFVVTGGPGTGKTTLVRGILEMFRGSGLRCQLAAPTGRAAKRLSESSGQQAKTLHRLLEFDRGGPKRNDDRPLQLDLLLIDECSMVDVLLMHQTLRPLPNDARLILVGDVDQLPSVGPGTVLADILDSKAIPFVRLTKIFRQAQESGIVRAAHAIRQGELPESSPSGKLGDFYFIEADAPTAIADRVIALLCDRIPARFKMDPFRDVQILTPMNRSELGVTQLNETLQSVLNPAQGDEEVARFGIVFRKGDKVLQTANDYQKEVFNGDVGRVAKIDAEEQELHVDFEGRHVVYEFQELDELSLAYAMTIHKSQGSEYPAVIIPLHSQHFMLLQRNLLYTGVTRGKRLVVIVGSKRALEMAVQRQDDRRRFTRLAWRLMQAESNNR